MSQLNLFDPPDPPLSKPLPVNFYPNFLPAEEADELLTHCLELQWQQNQIKMLGKTLPVPRLECIYGDEGCEYLYSNSVLLVPLPWTDALQRLRERVEEAVQYRFNIVIGNQYRSGTDSIGWHSDSEPTMGSRPAIASISLGDCRKFSMKPKRGFGDDTKHFYLGHGSLLYMQPGCQNDYVHQVPKTKQPVKTRINLTFRPHLKGKAK